MIQYKKEVWLGKSTIAFALILNVFLIKTAFTENDDLYWLLIASIPLLSIGIYISWQINRLRHKYHINRQQFDTLKPDFNWLPQPGYANHAEEIDLSISIGNEQCRQPYLTSVFNIEPMINIQDEKSIFHLLKEKKIDYPEIPNQDGLCIYSFGDGLVWQITPDYAGCCSKNGHFDNETFKKNAGSYEIKMIELILPSSHKFKCRFDSAFDINETLVAKKSHLVFQEPGYSTFKEAEGMIHFLDNLRKLSGGKPIGIRLCIKDKKEFFQICYAIRKTQFIPDFIVVEASVTKQPVANLKQKSFTPMPLYEALQFVSATLRMYSLENEIKIIAAGEIIFGFDILKILALGADSVYSEVGNYNKHIPDIIKIMQTAGFRKISDITLPNLFRSMKSSPGFNNLFQYQGALKNIYVSKLNTSIIKKEHMV